MYLKPAVERAEKLREGGAAPGRPVTNRPAPSTGPPGEPGSPEHRAACIGAYMSIQGLSPERAKATYERQLHEWQTSPEWRAEREKKGA